MLMILYNLLQVTAVTYIAAAFTASARSLLSGHDSSGGVGPSCSVPGREPMGAGGVRAAGYMLG